MIKVIFFDVGGTLIRPYPSVGAIYSNVAKRHGINESAERLEQKFKDAWRSEKSTRSKVTKEWWKQVVNVVFAEHKFDEPDAFFEDIYKEFEKKEVWQVFDDVLVTLNELKKRNIRLAVASNWDERLPALLTTLGLAPFFEAQFVSFHVGFAKPDRRFFDIALKTMNVDPLEAFHVGDDEKEDIEGAQTVGMRAYQIDRSRKPVNSRQLVSLTEILARI